MSQEIVIAGRRIGSAHEPYVICELSGNHNGSLERALHMMEAAAATGADAIKLQTYTPDTITIAHDGPGFRIEEGLWAGRTLHDLYGEAHTPFDWHGPLFAKAASLGVTVFSTPFDETAADLLADLDAPAFKIASFEAVDLPLIEYVARKGRPMIISTGLCSLEEIGEAVAAARVGGCSELAVLHCVSAYPAPVEDANVRTVPALADRFGCVAGLSDHTFGAAAAVASIVLGGAIVEKHFTLARADGGPDAAFSLEPAEFTAMTRACKEAWRALGRVHFDDLGSERAAADHRRSLYVVADVAAGEALTRANVRSIRPGLGLAPKHLPAVLGRRAARPLPRGTPLSWDALA